MADHRVSIKIQFSMHDHEKTWDLWLNWSDGIPDMIRDWVDEQQSVAMDAYWRKSGEADAMKAAKEEKQERELLAALKAKYDQTP